MPNRVHIKSWKDWQWLHLNFCATQVCRIPCDKYTFLIITTFQLLYWRFEEGISRSRIASLLISMFNHLHNYSFLSVCFKILALNLPFSATLRIQQYIWYTFWSLKVSPGSYSLFHIYWYSNNILFWLNM